MADPGPFEDALAHWLAALEARGEAGAVAAAVAPSIRLERYGFGHTGGQLLQILAGPAVVTAWLALTPEDVHFARDGAIDVSDDGVATCRYRLTHQDFANGGEWRFRLADDGRIAWLAHRPDSLPDYPTAEWEAMGRVPMKPNVIPAHEHGHPHGQGHPHDEDPDSRG